MQRYLTVLSSLVWSNNTQPGEAVIRRAFIVTMPFVLAPFPLVAMHLIQAKIVGCKLIHRHGHATILAGSALTVNPITLLIGLRRRQRVAEGKRCGSAGTAGILTFGFGWQAVMVTSLSAESGPISCGFQPGYFD
jgi:hypothetical protein